VQQGCSLNIAEEVLCGGSLLRNSTDSVEIGVGAIPGETGDAISQHFRQTSVDIEGVVCRDTIDGLLVAVSKTAGRDIAMLFVRRKNSCIIKT
jgi:hypothetical protein